MGEKGTKSYHGTSSTQFTSFGSGTGTGRQHEPDEGIDMFHLFDLENDLKKMLVCDENFVLWARGALAASPPNQRPAERILRPDLSRF